MNDLIMDPNPVSPYRYQFLSVDGIDAVDARKSERDTQLVTGPAWAIGGGRGHVGLHAMPHMLTVEALGQRSGAIGYFLGLNDAHVRKRGAAG